MKILLSGFEAFGTDTINPTQELLRDIAWLKKALSEANQSDLEIHSVILPVTFQTAAPRLLQEVKQLEPDVVLSFGQASGRGKISIERVAINCIDAEIKDNSGLQPRSQEILPDAPAAYFSTLPIEKIRQALEGAKIPCEISNTAGTYVCNHVFYHLMHAHQFSTRRCGFIHVPRFQEQVSRGEPSLSREQTSSALIAIIKAIAPTV